MEALSPSPVGRPDTQARRFITDKLWFRGCPLNKSQGQFFSQRKK